MQKNLILLIPVKNSSPIFVNYTAHISHTLPHEPLDAFGLVIDEIEIDTIIFDNINVTSFIMCGHPMLFEAYELLAMTHAKKEILHL